MTETRQSTLQRIQVGLIGLVVVLLFVSLASMVINRVADGRSVVDASGTSIDSVDGAQADIPAEPLAELGITPVAKEEASGNVVPNSKNVPRPTNQPR